MMSAIILAGNEKAAPEHKLRAVVRTLSALVPLVLGDIVTDATIVARNGMDFSAAEQGAGCRCEQDDDVGLALMRAARRTRRDRLLLLRAGYAPDASFADEIVEAIENEGPGTLRIIRAEPETFAQRMMPRLAPAVASVAPRSSVTGAKFRDDVTVARLANILAGQQMRARALRV